MSRARYLGVIRYKRLTVKIKTSFRGLYSVKGPGRCLCRIGPVSLLVKVFLFHEKFLL